MRENVRKLQVRYPVALDNDFVTWGAWHNQYWPAKYLVDRDGRVRRRTSSRSAGSRPAEID